MSQGNGSDSGAEPSLAATVEDFRLTLDGESHTVPIAAGETPRHDGVAKLFKQSACLGARQRRVEKQIHFTPTLNLVW